MCAAWFLSEMLCNRFVISANKQHIYCEQQHVNTAGWLVGSVTRTSVRRSFGRYDGQLASAAAADRRSWWARLGRSASWVRPVGSKRRSQSNRSKDQRSEVTVVAVIADRRLRLWFMCVLGRLCYAVLANSENTEELPSINQPINALIAGHCLHGYRH